MKFKELFIFILFLSISLFLNGQQISLVEKPAAGSFSLFFPSVETQIVLDPHDPVSVRTAATLFSNDVKMVTGHQPSLKNVENFSASQIVLVGTLENNRLIRELVQKKKISTDEIEGEWERFLIQMVDNPFPNVSKAW